MSAIQLEGDLAALLYGQNQPLQSTVREFVVLELYRRGTLSSGRAAQLLGMKRFEFVRYASRLGLAFYEMTDDEWANELEQVEAL